VRLHQREALPVVESALNRECLDFEVGAIDEDKKLCEDFGGGVAACETPHRQCVPFAFAFAFAFAFVSNAGVRRRHRMQWFQPSPRCNRGRQSRLCHRRGAAGGDQRQSSFARRESSSILLQECFPTCSTDVRSNFPRR
jgi:hypothetical protein